MYFLFTFRFSPGSGGTQHTLMAMARARDSRAWAALQHLVVFVYVSLSQIPWDEQSRPHEAGPKRVRIRSNSPIPKKLKSRAAGMAKKIFGSDAMVFLFFLSMARIMATTTCFICKGGLLSHNLRLSCTQGLGFGWHDRGGEYTTKTASSSSRY